MPNFDRTGPQGEGPFTGRGRGPFIGRGRPQLDPRRPRRGFFRRFFGRGFGRGLGRGRNQNNVYK